MVGFQRLLLAMRYKTVGDNIHDDDEHEGADENDDHYYDVDD